MYMNSSRDWHIYTVDIMYRIDNQWEQTVQPRELYLMHCGDLNGKQVQKRKGYTGLAKRLVWFEKPERTFWPTQYVYV